MPDTVELREVVPQLFGCLEASPLSLLSLCLQHPCSIWEGIILYSCRQVVARTFGKTRCARLRLARSEVVVVVVVKIRYVG
jgi:hypothetical protein